MPCHVVAAEDSARPQYEPQEAAAIAAGTATASKDAKRGHTDAVGMAPLSRGSPR